MRKKVISILLAAVAICCLFTGCTEAEKVNYNISKESNYFQS